MKTLRRGDNGEEVRLLQELLNEEGFGLVVDGDFGPATENAVEAYQDGQGLLVDGIVGRVTWQALLDEVDVAPAWGLGDEYDIEWVGWKKVPCDMTVPGDPNQGYDSTTLRVDVAEAFSRMRMQAIELGAKVTSAGGRRRVTKNANKNQSKKSFHYTGRAHDLALPSGMDDPHIDLYLVEPDPEHPRYWIVWARAEVGGEERFIDAWVHALQKTVRVKAMVINFTELAASHGFERIPSRRSYLKSNYGAAEWWHFQYELGLVPGESTFGEELLKVWRVDDLVGSVPWEHRDAVFGRDWF